MRFGAELDGLAQQLAPRSVRGRAVMLCGVEPGAGCSTLARALARRVSEGSGRPVWLFDLDFSGNPQAAAQTLNGQAYAGELNGLRFWRAEPDGAGRLALRKCADAPVFVSRFERTEAAVRRITFHPATEYWRRVRQACGLALIDAPAGSPAVGALAADLDGVVLVGDARSTSRRAAEARAAEIEAAGGRVLGVIVNRTPNASGLR